MKFKDGQQVFYLIGSWSYSLESWNPYGLVLLQLAMHPYDAVELYIQN